MKRFVHRRNDGHVLGHYANPQPYAMEEVEENHPDLVEFRDRNPKTRREKLAKREAEGTIEDRIAKLEEIVGKLRRNANG